MEGVKDIMLDENYDLLVRNGDFVIEESDDQHIDLIFNTYAGDWKEFADRGLGIESYLSSPNTKEVLRRDATVQCKADGYQISFDIKNDGPDRLIITPDYIRIRTH